MKKAKIQQENVTWFWKLLEWYWMKDWHLIANKNTIKALLIWQCCIQMRDKYFILIFDVNRHNSRRFISIIFTLFSYNLDCYRFCLCLIDTCHRIDTVAQFKKELDTAWDSTSTKFIRNLFKSIFITTTRSFSVRNRFWWLISILKQFRNRTRAKLMWFRNLALTVNSLLQLHLNWHLELRAVYRRERGVIVSTDPKTTKTTILVLISYIFILEAICIINMIMKS